MIRVMQGDCLSVMRSLPDGCVDMVLADPPYGTTQCKWDTVIDLPDLWDELRRVAKPSAAIVMTASQPFTSALIMSNPAAFKQAMVWVKNKASGHLNAKRRHMTQHEDVLLFSEGMPTYFPQKSCGHKPANYAKRARQSECYGKAEATEYAGKNTDRYPTTLLSFDVVNNDGSNGGRLHPTQKPVALMAYLIRTFTAEGEVVLDFAMGSGSTGIACIETKRSFIGIEKDAEIFFTAKQRIAAAKEQVHAGS